MQTKLYNLSGSEVGTIDLPQSIFGLPENADLVHQVRVGILANRRRPVAHTKDRSEVRGGGRKPWRQKGTGRARHGSRRSPIWKGGGVAHGPRNEKNYSQKINSGMMKRAVRTVLAAKHNRGQVYAINDFSVDAISTKKFKTMFGPITGGDFKGSLMVLPSLDKTILKSSRNLGLKVNAVGGLGLIDLLKAKRIIFTETALKELEIKN